MGRKPILITGLYKSATTWLGKMICYSGKYGNVYEPFNPDVSSLIRELEFPFEYICNENEHKYIKSLKKIMEFDYTLTSLIKDSKNIGLFRRNLQVYLEFKYFLYKNFKPLIKDPIAVFSTEWLAEKFNMDVIVMTRHPAGFISSIVKNNYGFDFDNLTNQQLLMDQHLNKYRKRITQIDYNLKNHGKKREHIIDYGILVWEIINDRIIDYRNKHKDWLFLRLEDLNEDPYKYLELIFSELNIEFDRLIKSKIDYRLKFRKVINTAKSWKILLTKNEIALIRKKLEEKASNFYGNSDW